MSKKTEPQESRVALAPESVKKLTGMKVNVAVESGAGVESGARAMLITKLLALPFRLIAARYWRLPMFWWPSTVPPTKTLPS
ncbi:MAG: hypothetical protein U0X75_02325 [Acidobacteriota bacterium]